MNRARLCAYRSLCKSVEAAAYASIEMDTTLQNTSLSPEDRALYSQLFLGVVEKKITLDYLLSRICHVPLNKMDLSVLCILELGLFQILYLDRIPDRAAIFEAGEMAKKYCPASLGVINAVLRRASREKEETLAFLDLPGKKGLALRYGYPRYLVTLWQDSYGKEKCLEILKAQNTRAALTLRINTLKTSLSDYTTLLDQERIEYHKNPLCRNGITVKESCNPVSLPGFEEGLFFIQDAAAQKAVDLLEAKPGERILDLCAAPGGKSFGAAMDMDGKGEILSCDLYPSRLEKIQSGAKRLGISIIGCKACDSSQETPEWNGTFDRVICDVPCSGYGVIAKKPDIRHKDKSLADDLPQLQYSILEKGAKALRSRGRLLYSTCTLNPAENEAVTDRFLSLNPQFERVGKAETIFPVGGQNDGFFCDLLEKKHD